MVICTNFNSAAYQKQYTLTMDKVNNKNEKQHKSHIWCLALRNVIVIFNKRDDFHGGGSHDQAEQILEQFCQDARRCPAGRAVTLVSDT